MTQLSSSGCSDNGDVVPSSSGSDAFPLHNASLALKDDLYFMEHVLDMPKANGFMCPPVPTNSPPAPHRSRLLGHRQSGGGTGGGSGGGKGAPAPMVSNGTGSQFTSSPPCTSPNQFVTGFSGMKEVPTWLKTLRLHKYTPMFQDMSYDEMMNLDERQLEQRKVTKGARKKILQSLEKLRERVPHLRSLAANMDEKSDFGWIISELRAMMNTPIAAYSSLEETERQDNLEVGSYDASDQNLPGHISYVASRMHDLLINRGKIHDIEDEFLLKLLQVYEKISSHESFSNRQKSVAAGWKRALRKIAVDRSLLPGGGHVGVGYAGFKRTLYQTHTGKHCSYPSTRSSTNSPPAPLATTSPSPMTQAFSSPASVSGHLPDYERLRQHPEGKELLHRLEKLRMALNQNDDHRKGRRPEPTVTPPEGLLDAMEKASLTKSASLSDNSSIIEKPIDDKRSFIHDNMNMSHTSSIPPLLPPRWDYSGKLVDASDCVRRAPLAAWQNAPASHRPLPYGHHGPHPVPLLQSRSGFKHTSSPQLPKAKALSASESKKYSAFHPSYLGRGDRASGAGSPPSSRPASHFFDPYYFNNTSVA